MTLKVHDTSDWIKNVFEEVKKEQRLGILEYEKNTLTLLNIRNKLSKEKQNKLDIDFKATFEKLELCFYQKKYTFGQIFNELKKISDSGGTGALLDPHELGKINFPTLIRFLPDIKDKEERKIAYEILLLTLNAGVVLHYQKAYAGNGGVPAIFWIIELVSTKNADEELKNISYHLFIKILASYHTTEKPELLNFFLMCAKPVFSILDIKIFLHLLTAKMLVKTHEDEYYCHFEYLTSFEIPKLTQFFSILFMEEREITKLVKPLILHHKEINFLINVFTSSKEYRKFFRNHFRQKVHWFTSAIVENYQEILISLVKRKEVQLLEVFVHLHKKTLKSIKDKDGHNLLYWATRTSGKNEKLIQLLMNAGISMNHSNEEA